MKKCPYCGTVVQLYDPQTCPKCGKVYPSVALKSKTNNKEEDYTTLWIVFSVFTVISTINLVCCLFFSLFMVCGQYSVQY